MARSKARSSVAITAQLGFVRLQYGLVREDGVWVVSDPKGDPVKTC